MSLPSAEHPCRKAVDPIDSLEQAGMLATMWPVYSTDRYRDALAQWDAGQSDPDDRRTASYRRICLDAEALAVADAVTSGQRAMDNPLPVLILNPDRRRG